MPHVYASARNYAPVINNTKQKFNAIYVGDGGDVVVSVNPEGLNPVTFTAVPASSFLPVYGEYIVSAPLNSVWLNW